MIKTLSGAAMLLFLLALLLSVLEKTGLVRKQTACPLMKTALICVGFGLAYDGVARLVFALCCDTEGAPGIRELYSAGWLETYYTGLETGSGLLNLPGHWLGRLLFGEFLMGGVVFSTLLTAASLHLFYLRLRALRGEGAARTGQALMLVFPGAFFCFLPGWGAWALLGAALIFTAIGQKRKRAVRAACEWTASVTEALFAVMGVLNGLLLMLLVMR